MSARRLWLVPVVAALLVSCGLTTDSSPETLSRENLPEDLGGASASTSLPDAPQMSEVTLWFVKAGEDSALEPTQRAVPLNSSIQVVLENLLSGPTQAEQQEVRTAIPEGLILPEDADLTPDEDGVIVLDLPRDFYEDPAVLRDAYAQVVLTVTEMPGVSAVQFQYNGEDQNVLNGRGREVDRPVRAADYANLTQGLVDEDGSG